MKNVLLTLVCGVFCSSTLVSSVQAQSSTDIAAIKQVRAQQNAAIASKDFVAVATAWTEDVSARAGLGKDIQGRQAYLAAFRADSAMTYTRETVDVVVSSQWPLAYERGRWTGSMRGIAGAPLLSGEYSAQWVRGPKDGSSAPNCLWRCAVPGPRVNGLRRRRDRSS